MRKVHTPTLEELRAKFGTALMPSASSEERERALMRLQVIATTLRRRGMAEEHNPAVTLLRSAGVLPARPPYPIPDELLTQLQSAGVRARELRALRALLAFREKPVLEYTTEDIEAFVRRPPLGGAALDSAAPAAAAETVPPGGRDNERRLLRCLFRKYFKHLGLARENPVLDRSAPRMLSPTKYPEVVRADYERMLSHAKHFTRKTKTSLIGSFDRARRWAAEFRSDEIALSELLWREGECEAVLRWLLRPNRDGTAKSNSSVHPALEFLRILFLSSGRVRREVRDHLDDVKRNLRVDKSDYGPLTALGLRDEDAAPAPADDQVGAIRETLARDAAHLGSLGVRGKGRLRKALRNRALLETFIWLGGRLGSVASFRADQIFVDRSDDSFYFDSVIVKRTHRRTKPLLPERWVDEYTYSRWVLPTPAFESYCDLFAARGYDLREYVRTRRRELIPWVRVTAPNTFGPDAVGHEVSPLWFGGTDGYLSSVGIATVMHQLCRSHGIDRGQVHIFRRYAAVQTNEAAAKSQTAVLKVLRMTEEIRRRYVVSVESSVHKVYPQQKSASAALAAPNAAAAGLPAAAPEVAGPRAADVSQAAATPKRKRKAMSYTLADVLHATH